MVVVVLKQFISMLMCSILVLLAVPILVVAGKEVYISCQRDGDIAFTFDQGPSMYTGKLLSALQKARIKATFHVVPDYLDNPILLAYLKKAAADGHQIGLAVKMPEGDNKQDDKEIMARIERARNTIAKHINYAPQFLRFPNDSPPSSSLLNAVWAKGMTVTGYNLDSQDYLFVNDTSPEPQGGAVFSVFKGVFDAIEPPAKGAFIAVQRDLVGPSVNQAEAIFSYAKQKGYRAVRLDECIGNRSPSETVTDAKDQKVIMEGQANFANILSPLPLVYIAITVALIVLM